MSSQAKLIAASSLGCAFLLAVLLAAGIVFGSGLEGSGQALFTVLLERRLSTVWMILSFACVFLFLTLRAPAEAERNRFAVLMSKLAQGVIVCNPDGRVLLCNRSAYALPALTSSISSNIANSSGFVVPTCLLLPPPPVATVRIFPATQYVPLCVRSSNSQVIG